MTADNLSFNVFNLLAKPVRNALNELGFSNSTLPQEMAIPPILAGENVLLIAPTGSGKTEAVLLPIFSNLIRVRSRGGISVLYVTPLRALNRDLLKRLSFWSTRLGVSIEVRHGDTEMRLRRRQAISPPAVLVTTPETLQAILPGSRMRQHLSQVRCVIVDEVHELASSKRGAQLSVALERLRELSGEFQRIGLSATVGNPNDVGKFVVGEGRNVKIIEAALPKGYRYRVEYPTPVEADYDLAGKLNTSPEAAARIRRVAELVDGHRSTLIFVNARTIAEMLGYRLSQMGRVDVAVHHGSLSKEVRAQIEDEFKSGNLKAIVCTSTLELGIDIGNVDLVIQYLSPRQVNSLIQRVGRSGHRLDMLSEGVIITAFSDDTLESIAAVRNAQQERLEPVSIHKNALDVLAHQIAGIIMDKGSVSSANVLTLLRRAYPYRNLKKKEYLDVIYFLERLGQLRVEQEGNALRKGRKTRKYYYENLSMIPDERRYPIVNVISDRKVGTLGDEFMATKARVGLNIIVRGRVWRIVQIEQETGIVYVVPSEDPLAAVPGWDGEMIPLPFDLAQQTGKLRGQIAQVLKETGHPELAVDKLAERLSTDKPGLLRSVQEVDEHLKHGAPLATDRRIVVEGFDKYVIVHACFGEIVNRTLGCIFDAVLSDKEVIVGWHNDGYRILIETSGRLTQQEFDKIAKGLFRLTDEEVERAFREYMEAKFPFSYKMKFIADRFGALPRGKTMSYEKLSQLPARFGNTPIYDETLREAMMEKIDIQKAKDIIGLSRSGKMEVSTFYSVEKPTPMAYHILEKFSDMSELMASESLLLSNIDRMKMTIEARTASLLCMSCNEWSNEKKIRALQDNPSCEKCGSRLLALLYRSQDPNGIRTILRKRKDGENLTEDEVKQLSHARRTADLILSYGKGAIVALQVKGVGPETAFRILGKMHQKQDEFYMDLLRAKIQYLRTREFWEDKRDRKPSRFDGQGQEPSL